MNEKELAGMTILMGAGIIIGGTIATVVTTMMGLRHGRKQWANGVSCGIAIKELELCAEEIRKKHETED